MTDLQKTLNDYAEHYNELMKKLETPSVIPAIDSLSAFNVDSAIRDFNIEDTVHYKTYQETKELNQVTREILSQQNAVLVNLSRQVEELQKSNDSLSNLNKKYDKELKEAKKELKKTKKYNAVALAVAIISMLSAIIIPFIIK